MIFELDKKVLIYWRFTAAVIFAAVFSALWLLIPISFVIKSVASVILFGCFSLYYAVYLPKRFLCENVEVSNGKTVCRKGVIFKREYIYPNQRLIYIQTVKLPLAHCFGLFSIVFRGVGHSLILPVMTQEQMIRFLKAVRTYE